MPGPVSVCLSVTKTVPQLVDWGGYGTLGGRSFLGEWCYQECALKVHALPLLLFFLPVCRWKMSSSSFLLGPETLAFPKWLPFLSCHDQLYPPAIVGQSKQVLVSTPVKSTESRQGRDWRQEPGGRNWSEDNQDILHPQWAGSSHVKQEQGNTPTDLLISQSDGGIFSVEVFFSQITLACVKLTKGYPMS